MRGYILNADNHRQSLVPKGFAHGFCTLVPHTIVMYKVDEYYSAEHDSGLLWEDKELAIPWPVTLFCLIKIEYYRYFRNMKIAFK